jgi:hypothetical protein
MQHRSIQHVQGYTGSLWTPPSGDYLLHSLGGRQGNSKQNNDVLCTHCDGHFDGHQAAAVLYHVHCLIEEVQDFHKSH